MTTEENILNHKISYQGKEYLILPDACEYTKMNATAIHQLIARGKIKRDVDVVQRVRYVFLTLKVCEELKNYWHKKVIAKKLSKLSDLNIPEEEIDRIITKLKKKEEGK